MSPTNIIIINNLSNNHKNNFKTKISNIVVVQYNRDLVNTIIIIRVNH